MMYYISRNGYGGFIIASTSIAPSILTQCSLRKSLAKFHGLMIEIQLQHYHELQLIICYAKLLSFPIHESNIMMLIDDE